MPSIDHPTLAEHDVSVLIPVHSGSRYEALSVHCSRGAYPRGTLSRHLVYNHVFIFLRKYLMQSTPRAIDYHIVSN